MLWNMCFCVCYWTVISSCSICGPFYVMQGIKIYSSSCPCLTFLKNSKFSIRNLLMWGLIALLILGNIFFNQADSDLIYIVIFMLYCSKSKPEDVIKTYYISASMGIVLVIAAWFIGAIPSEVRDGRACLGFYFATFGPNLFTYNISVHCKQK